MQEEMYEAEYRYLRLLTQDDPRVRERAREKFETAFWAVAPVPPAIPRVDENRLADLRQEIAELEMSPFGKPKPNGEPWIKSSVKDTVKSRLGTAAKPATDQAPPPPPTPGT